MNGFKNAILTSATVFTALGVGHVMQSSRVAELRYPEKAVMQPSEGYTAAEPSDAAPGPFSGITDLELTSIAFTSATVVRPLSSEAEEETITVPGFLIVSEDKNRVLVEDNVHMAQPMPEPNNASVSCAASLTARPMAAAMVELNLAAPCEPDTRVTLHHNGMMISERTDNTGSLMLQMPALAETAVYMAAFQSGKTAMAKAQVSSVDIYDRVVVQWEGPGEMQIHAFEFGADYAEAGHVWAASPRDMAEAALGRGGFLAQFGRKTTDQDLRAQAYTFPSGTTTQRGLVSLEIEAEVTAETCGRRMEGQALQLKSGGALSVTDLAIEMPACDAIGDFLVLKNLLQDMKIAQN